MEEKKLNVLFISSWYPNKYRPLLGIFVKRHAAAVALKCNVSAIFICAGDDNSIEESVEDGIYTIRGYYKAQKDKLSSFTRLGKLIRHLILWRKVWLFYSKKKGRPDIINVNVVYPVSVIAMVLKAMKGIPYVITEHWSGYFPENGKYKGLIKKLITKRAVAKAGAVIVPSFKLSRTMQALGLANNYTIIPNVVDETIFHVSDDATHSAKPVEFIHISSLEESSKNISGIISTFKKFHLAYPDSKLTVIWDEEEKQYFEKVKGTYSERDGIFLYGKREGAELAGMMAKASAFVLFSNYENLPCVMLESFCSGVPVIATRVGDIPEYINEKNGILIDSKNEEQLYKAMEKIYLNKGKYNPDEIRNMVVAKVSPAAIANQFLDVYNAVLQIKR